MKTIFSRSGKARGFTLIELLVSMFIMVGLFQSIYFIYNNFLVASKRLSVMSNSNQELERLRATMYKDLRAAVEFKIENDGKKLTLTCAIDEAAIDQDSLSANDALARTAISDNGVNIMDGQNAALYYDVVYEFQTQSVITENSYGWKDNPDIVDHGKGLIGFDEGVIVRTGPRADPTRGNVTLTTLNEWNTAPASTKFGMVVSEGWFDYSDPTNIKPVFDFWPTAGAAGKDDATGVSIKLWRRDSFKTPSRRYDYPQEFSTFLTSRIFR